MESLDLFLSVDKFLLQLLKFLLELLNFVFMLLFVLRLAIVRLLLLNLIIFLTVDSFIDSGSGILTTGTGLERYAAVQFYLLSNNCTLG